MAKEVALITDGRFSGGSHGMVVGHVAPEAQEGGPIALLRDGDRITIDSQAKTLSVDLSEQELERRFLVEALERSGGNVTRAAEDVGIQRTNFHALMRKYGLTADSLP